MRYYGWPEYVPVAQRREKALKQIEKMKKKGLKVQPVQLTGRTIATSFWGKGWCDHIESFSDYVNRLPRGRTYVRNGSVCHLEIRKGVIEALVSGTSLYKVNISIKPLPDSKWQTVKRACSGRIGSLIDLLKGKLDHVVMEVVTHRRNGLFPLSGEIKFDCDCPDWADMCKHVAAVLYGVGAKLDHSPELLFLLRGVNHDELVDVSRAITDVAKAGTSRRRIASSGIADVFGIDIAETVADSPPDAPVRQTVKKRLAQSATPENAKTGRAMDRKAGPEVAVKQVKTVRGNKRSGKVSVKKKSTNNFPSFPESLTGDAIRSWRLALGETQAAFASRIGVTAASISQWERKGASSVGMFSGTLQALRKEWGKTKGGR